MLGWEEKILMYRSKLSLPLGMSVHCQGSLVKSLRLWRDVTLVFIVCRKLDGKDKVLNWLGADINRNRAMVVRLRIEYMLLLRTGIIFIIIWDFLMFYQIFFSPQVKRWAIITYKQGIYEFLHKLPNDLRLRKLGNIRKS